MLKGSTVNRGGRRPRQSVDSAASADDSRADTTHVSSARRARTTWDDATVACMLRLRFQELRDHFQACKTVFETAEAWVVLASELNARMGTLFESHQVQAKVGVLHFIVDRWWWWCRSCELCLLC